MRISLLVLGLLSVCLAVAQSNLARTALATASESQDDLTPEKAVDGRQDTRWSGIPGHNSGVWYQLEWSQPVLIAQVIIHQYDRFTFEMDVQVWDESAADWRTLSHHGKPGVRLPRVLVSEFDKVKTNKLRIGNITNGPSFNEVEVFAERTHWKAVLEARPDLRGNIVGALCDKWGQEGIPGAKIRMEGATRAGPFVHSTKTDDRGLFRLPLPLGHAENVSLSYAAGKLTGGTTIPEPWLLDLLEPISVGQEVLSLNGDWLFIADPPDMHVENIRNRDTRWRPIKVPGHWAMQGYQADVGAYRRVFDLPPGKGRLKLRFDGVYSKAEVYLNGLWVGAHDGGAFPFEMDITEVAKPGRNVLTVRAEEHSPVSDKLDHMSLYADFPLGGIIRKVSLFRVPDARVVRFEQQTQWRGRDAKLSGSLTFFNQRAPAITHGAISFRLVDITGKPVQIKCDPIPFTVDSWKERALDFQILVPNPKAWHAENPNLYLLIVEARDGKTLLHKLKQRIGFRQTTVSGSKLLVNGTPVKLKGTCHHDSDPLLGRAVTPDLEWRDVALMKEANLNSFRTSHYPPCEELLDEADRKGMYVECEGAFCWADETDDITLTPTIIAMTAQLAAFNRNHPSVTVWSVCNESGMGSGLWRARDWLREADRSRPITGSYHRDGDMDIAIRHNPITVREIGEVAGLKQPLLWDESFCIYQGIWGDAEELWRDPGVRDYYVEPLQDVYEAFWKSEVVQGSQIWCWSDDLFLLPGAGLQMGRGDTPSRYVEERYRVSGRGVVGDAPWGVVDGWRRPKPEFFYIKKMHSPVRMPEDKGGLIWSSEAGQKTLRIPVENRYDFTNLSQARFEWSSASGRGVARVSVPPRGRGELVLDPAPTLPLTITVYDPAGRVVDRFAWGAGSATTATLSGEPATVTMSETRTLAGQTVYLKAGPMELAVNRELGQVVRLAVGGRSLFWAPPKLHVWRMGRQGVNFPPIEDWVLEKLSIDGSSVRVQGRYGELTGFYLYTLMADGSLDIRADFVNNGPEFDAREVGIRLSLPSDARWSPLKRDRLPTPRKEIALEWRRRAEYGAYPEDHIGRPVGRASARPNGSLSWSQDDSSLGTNDFRSAKRNAEWVALSLGGVGLQVFGPLAAVRASLEGEDTALYALSHYGGSNSRWEWIANYGHGLRVKTGDHLRAGVRLSGYMR